MWIISKSDDAWGDDIYPVYCLSFKYSKAQIINKMDKLNQNVKKDTDPRFFLDRVPLVDLNNIN